MAGPQDFLAQLQALTSQGSGPVPRPTGGNPMIAAIQAAMGGDPRGAMAVRGMPVDDEEMTLANRGTKAGLGGDQDYYDIHAANQGVRGNLPPMGPTNDYSGFADDMAPMRDIRQTPMPMAAMPDGGGSEMPYKPNVGAPGAPGQSIMGAYLNRNKGEMSTEDELADVQKKMGGSGDPVADGNFPSQKEIDALNSGKMSAEEFDAKWGKGAAKEMMEKSIDKEDDNDEDDNY